MTFKPWLIIIIRQHLFHVHSSNMIFEMLYVCEEKTCTGYQAMYIYVLNKNPGFMIVGTKPMSHFCGSSVFWKVGYHPSF